MSPEAPHGQMFEIRAEWVPLGGLLVAFVNGVTENEDGSKHVDYEAIFINEGSLADDLFSMAISTYEVNHGKDIGVFLHPDDPIGIGAQEHEGE